AVPGTVSTPGAARSSTVRAEKSQVASVSKASSEAPVRAGTAAGAAAATVSGSTPWRTVSDTGSVTVNPPTTTVACTGTSLPYTSVAIPATATSPGCCQVSSPGRSHSTVAGTPSPQA